jgi:hypothetical protein
MLVIFRTGCLGTLVSGIVDPRWTLVCRPRAVQITPAQVAEAQNLGVPLGGRSRAAGSGHPMAARHRRAHGVIDCRYEPVRPAATMARTYDGALRPRWNCRGCGSGRLAVRHSDQAVAVVRGVEAAKGDASSRRSAAARSSAARRGAASIGPALFLCQTSRKSRSATLPAAVAVRSVLNPTSRSRAGSGWSSRKISQCQAPSRPPICVTMIV